LVSAGCLSRRYRESEIFTNNFYVLLTKDTDTIKTLAAEPTDISHNVTGEAAAIGPPECVALLQPTFPAVRYWAGGKLSYGQWQVLREPAHVPTKCKEGEHSIGVLYGALSGLFFHLRGMLENALATLTWFAAQRTPWIVWL